MNRDFSDDEIRDAMGVDDDLGSRRVHEAPDEWNADDEHDWATELDSSPEGDEWDDDPDERWWKHDD